MRTGRSRVLRRAPLPRNCLTAFSHWVTLPLPSGVSWTASPTGGLGMTDPRRVASELEDPFLRRSVVTALHLRRYMPFYVFGVLWVVTLALFPSLSNDGGGDESEFGAGGAV